MYIFIMVLWVHASQVSCWFMQFAMFADSFEMQLSKHALLWCIWEQLEIAPVASVSATWK